MRPVYGVLLLALALCGLVYLADRFFRNRGHRASGPGWRERLRGWLDALSRHEEEQEWGRLDDDGRSIADVFACPNCGRSGYVNGLCNRCGYGYGYQPAYQAEVTAVYGPGQIPSTEAAGADDTDIMAAPRLCAGREPVYVPVAQRWITPENVPRPRYATPQTSAPSSADGPALARDLVAASGPGHFQPPDHIRQQVRALMAEYFPPPRIAIEAS